ncbi:hypothetical protein DL96DRAFT_1820687 [Flagelloscypha sp. PMI_526]|nr:hypothetical protein DL96DRAFT_1820687 [Flagelloscypha sp. PMI_526]
MFDLCCFISGVSTWFGPQSFLEDEKKSRREREDLLSGIMSKLRTSENANLDLPPEDELRETLMALLKGCSSDYDNTESNPVSKSMNTWNREVVIIGPGGQETSDGINSVQLRLCADYSIHGSYGGPEPAIFMDSRCWSYLKFWITHPSVSPAKDSEISFYTEFWELVKGDFKHEYYPSTKLDYSPLQFARDDYQEPPIGGKAGVKHALEKMCLENLPKLRQALCRGIRGKKLGIALLDDFQIWAFESPDIWPNWDEFDTSEEPVFTTFTTTSTHPLSSFPLELLIEIFADTTPYDVLAVASTCRTLRQFLIRQDIFSALLREMILRGSLRWLNPCPSAPNEVIEANLSLSTWIHNKGTGIPTHPFQAPGFRFLPFVHTCFVHSFSMRSRRRLWGIIKQVEKRWIAVRNGKKLGGEDDPDKWELISYYDCGYYTSDSEDEDGSKAEMEEIKYYDSEGEEEDGGMMEVDESKS